MSAFCAIEDLANESDVEQKLVYPLITWPVPTGLGYSPAEVKTKSNIRRLTIGKGAEEKLYFPDYVVLIAAVPVMAIEVKSPGEDLKQALREARLYAAALNAKYPPGINPCHRVIATDGNRILLSVWDSDEVEVAVEFADIQPATQSFTDLSERASRTWAKAHVERILIDIRDDTYVRPLNLIGGESVRNEAIGANTFGATISTAYRHLFNPTTSEDRAFIAIAQDFRTAAGRLFTPQ